MPVVSNNSFQERLRRSWQETRRPDPFTVLEARCIIQQIYDPEVLELDGVPEEIAHMIIRNPGFLFAKVKLAVGEEVLYLPFAASADEIFSNYGTNSVQLQGLPAKILYRSSNLEAGQIVITGNPYTRLANPVRTTEVWSIADIFG